MPFGKILTFFLITLLMFSCDMGDDSENNAAETEGDSVLIVLSLSSIETDSVTYSLEGLASCQLSGSAVGGDYEELASWTVSDTADLMYLSLEPGTWSFLFTAYDGEGAVLMEIVLDDQTISASGYLSFDLPQLETGTGGLEYTLSWPSDSGIDSAEVSLDGAAAEALTIVNGDDASYVIYASDATEAGDRSMSFNLTYGDEIVSYVDEILILDSLRMSKSVTLSDIDINIAPSAPSSLSVSSEENLNNSSAGTVALSWVDNSYVETGFDIQYSEDGTTWTDIVGTEANESSHSALFTRGFSYYFRLRAENNYGSSDWVTSTESVEVPYLVVFIDQVGSDTASQEVFSGDRVTEPEDPTYTDSEYSFAGWYEDSDFTTAWDYTTGISASLTLYGKWVYSDLAFSIGDGEVTITAYAGDDADVAIPATIAGFPVTSIGRSAFYECSSLVSVSLPDSLNSIEANSFYKCNSLESVTFPENLASLEMLAFCYCTSLVSISLPDNLTTIGQSAFLYCESLSSVSLPDSLVWLGPEAFSYSTIDSISLPASLTYIGYRAFHSCESLSTVTCEAVSPPTLNLHPYVDENVFDNNADGRVIYVPADSVDSYKTAENWSDYADAIEAIPE